MAPDPSGPPVAIREAVLAAALAVFTRYTFDGTRMAQVAEQAGVAVGSIYRYFPSKEALGNAVYQRWKTKILEYMRADLPAGGDVRAEFAAIWDGLVRFASDHPDALAFLEHQQHESYLDDQSCAISLMSTELGSDVIRRGQRSGVIRPDDPDVLIALVYGAFVGLSKAIRGGLKPSDADLQGAEDAVWALLRAH